MLSQLHVRDLALIEEIWLEFKEGMNVLSGETGAGKTALVEALKLLAGARADSGMIRAGSQEALVEGVIEQDGREILVKRRLTTDGRSKCSINGEISTVRGLTDLLGPMLDMHGQHEHQALLNPATHVSYLDRYIGDHAVVSLAAYVSARGTYLSAEKALADLVRSLEASNRELEDLRFLVAEIDAVAPQAGEDEQISSEVAVLQHSARLTEAAAEAHAWLSDDGGLTDSASKALHALARSTGIDARLDQLKDRLEDVLSGVHDIGFELRDYIEKLAHNQEELEARYSRLATLTDLKKKYGSTIEEVLARHADAVQRLEFITDGESGLAQARAALDEARSDYESAAATLAALREGSVEEFLEKLHDAASDLAMEAARFDVSITQLHFGSWATDGPHRVEFTFAPGPDQPFRPLGRIASGGELSRVMLALKSVLGKADRVPILVFDEVDAGIGGMTAISVGKRLKTLAREHQVLVVTHLPQVAAFADEHLVVSKSVDDSKVRTTVVTVKGEAREGEIARMLAGKDSDKARAHARELLLSASEAETGGGSHAA